MQHITLIGYGEVGQIFAHALHAKGAQVSAWDLKLAPDHPKASALSAMARDHHISATSTLASALTKADLVISAVTASNTLAVARAAAAHIDPGTYFLDLNSASPGTKQQAAQAIEAAGGHYVEAGVMTSVPPYGIQVPMLLGGTSAATLALTLRAWGMSVTVVSAQVGVASATKMSRSIMIKGLEALVIESFSTARHYGVEDAMVATLQETFPSINWHEQAAYFFMRVAQHGQRRAEEMRESAATVSEAGFAPLMGTAIADKQQWVADQAAAGIFGQIKPKATWQAYADALLVARERQP
jgi:3-hydroxyisobutyrate dehydrogenase-like beta-hydroxyacid dehydrogenase